MVHELSLIHVGQLVIGECSCGRWSDRVAHGLNEPCIRAEEEIRKGHAAHVEGRELTPPITPPRPPVTPPIRRY